MNINITAIMNGWIVTLAVPQRGQRIIYHPNLENVREDINEIFDSLQKEIDEQKAVIDKSLQEAQQSGKIVELNQPSK